LEIVIRELGPLLFQLAQLIKLDRSKGMNPVAKMIREVEVASLESLEAV
jgi:hypothetical protein